jgi:hypothetical protein
MVFIYPHFKKPGKENLMAAGNAGSAGFISPKSP